MSLAQVRLDSGDVASVVADFLSQFDLLSPEDRANAMQTMISDLPDMLKSIRDDAIVDLKRSGWSAGRIADLLLMSEWSVENVLAPHKDSLPSRKKVPQAQPIVSSRHRPE